MVDTNSDPRDIDYPIPANDDASKSIKKILMTIVDAIKEGLELRKNEKDAAANSDLKDSSDVLKLSRKLVNQDENIDSKIKDEGDKEN